MGGKKKAELTAQTVQTHFIKRLGTTLDVAFAVLFLASEESAFVTGTSLVGLVLTVASWPACITIPFFLHSSTRLLTLTISQMVDGGYTAH